MEETRWPPEWTRAILSQATLAVVAAEETTYGYQIIQRLEAAGLGKVKGGTLYPILARLEKEGLVSSSWGEGDGGPGRKFISITDEGRHALSAMAGQWDEYSSAMRALWTPEEKHQ